MKDWMLEFILRRLPKPESVRKTWVYALRGESLLTPPNWDPTPHSLALGVGLGWFVGLLPIFGVKTDTVLLLGSIIRCHLPAAVLGTYISNPLTMPALLALQYLVGDWIVTAIGFQTAIQVLDSALLSRIFLSVLAGSVVSAACLGVLGYLGIRILLGSKMKQVLGGVV